MPGEMSFGLLFHRIRINLESFNFLQNNHFFNKKSFLSSKPTFLRKKGIMCLIVDLKVGSDWLADQEWFLA